MANRKTMSVCALVALAGLPAAASAQIKGIFCNDVTRTNSVVPTIGGNFAAGNTSATAFDRPFLSPNGLRWILGAVSEAGADDKDLVIIGGGQTGAGASTVAVEDAPTSFDPTRTLTLIETQMGINDAGQYVFSGDLDVATTDDEVVVVFNGVSQSVAIREGQPSPVAGQNFGTASDSAHILADGTPRYRAVLAPTTTIQIIASGAALLGQTDVLSPTGQLVAPSQTVDNFAANRFVSSADGLHSMWKGDLNVTTTTDDVIVVDGAVVCQEGANLPGGVLAGTNVGVINGDLGSQQMSANGLHWMFRTAMADGTGITATDVVIKNGALFAKTGDPITPAASEQWEDITAFTTTFFVNTCNSHGDVVLGGTTNNPDFNLDAVLVYYPASGTPTLLAREGDPVDLDGNGAFDDDAFIDVFGNDDGVLSDDGHYYFVASIQNSLNVSTGNAFLVVTVPSGVTPCYANCDLSTALPVLTANDFQCFLNEYASGNSYANCDGSTTSPVLTANDFQCFLNAYAAGCS